MENGKGALVSSLSNNIGFGSTEFHVIRSDKTRINPLWLYKFTTLNKFRLDAARNMTGSAGQKRVPASFLKNYKIILPPLELQNQFADFVQKVDKSKYLGAEQFLLLRKIFYTIIPML